MNLHIFITPLVISLALVPSIGDSMPVRPPVPVLPDIQRHLIAAAHMAQREQWHEAVAHADLILVQRPLRICIDQDKTPIELRKPCLQALAQGLTLWKEAFQDEIDFIFVSDRDKADINVKFLPHVRVGGKPIAGFVNWRREVSEDENGRATARVTASIEVRFLQVNGKDMPLASMAHTIAHEMGHVIGLDDSARQGDIMGPLSVRKPAHCLAPGELDALELVREQAELIRAQALTQTP